MTATTGQEQIGVAAAASRSRALEANRNTPAAFLRRLLRGYGARVGLIILILVVVAAVFAPWLAPHNPEKGELLLRLRPPGDVDGQFHLLGTDQLGRDVLSRLIYGSRVSLLVGGVAVVLGGLIGLLTGFGAGYFGGHVDTVIMRVVDVQMAFPFVLLALAIVALLGPSLVNMIIVFTVTEWYVYARVVRASTLALRDQEFVQAARVLGMSHPRILVRHILPNVMSPLTVIASFELAKIIATEAALSFLGLGIRPPTPSWGNMLADGREHLQNAYWVAVFPGLALMLTVLAVNLLGDALRDVLDPRMERLS